MGIEAIYNYNVECTDEYVFSPNPPMTKTASKFYTLHNITDFQIEGSYDVVLTQNLCIPPLPPSYDHCGFIKISYRVFVKLYTRKRFSSDHYIYLQVVIGTIPLKDVLNELEPCAVVDDDYIQPSMPTSITSEFDLENVQFWEEESHIAFEEDTNLNIYFI
uniref:Arrestin C-terminal-like domain-containing protein n=1 Tax=Panagrolaimus davidi TaxID=227884 RepID=A0A914PME4_9BILA